MSEVKRFRTVLRPLSGQDQVFVKTADIDITTDQYLQKHMSNPE